MVSSTMVRRFFKVGQDVTLVGKGTRRSDHGSVWTDTTEIGHTSFFKITSIGVKYLHGSYIYWDQGERHDRDWPSKVLMEDIYRILPGIHHELKERYTKYRNAINEWEDARDKQRRHLEWELRDFVNTKMEEWRKEHPYPTIDLR